MTELDFLNFKNELGSTGKVDAQYSEEFSSLVGELLDLATTFYEEEITEENIYDNIVLDRAAIHSIAAGKRLDSAEEIASDIEYLISLLDGADMSDFFGSNGWRKHLEWQ